MLQSDMRLKGRGNEMLYSDMRLKGRGNEMIQGGAAHAVRTLHLAI